MLSNQNQKISEQSSLQGYFRFDPQDAIYQEHFKEFGVVPGSLIIHAFLEVAQVLLPHILGFGVTKFRFRSFVTPGVYAYQVIRDHSGYLACSLKKGSHSLVTGRLTYET